MSNQYGYFFDQEKPEVPIVGMIAECDWSQPYELDQGAVFEAEHGYLVVFVSGCSCWPDRGTTTQIACPRKDDVDKALSGHLDLLQACQDAGWKAL